MRPFTASVLVGAILSPVLLSHPATSPAAPENIVANDNRTPAGVLRDGVLTLRLEMRQGIWHPDGEANPGVETWALAEEGRPPQIPGPLIRVPEGTEIHATIRNSLANSPLSLRGFYSRPAPAGGSPDSIVRIPAGEVRELRFKAGVSGTYNYWARTDTLTRAAFDTTAAQLFGALVIDPRGAQPNRDRILVLGGFVYAAGTPPGGRPPVVWHINGRSWPHTDRLSYTVGDSVHFRVINATPVVHPIHLHGFYFRVDSRGNGARDSVYAPGERPWEFTDRLAGAGTISLTWVPEREGNWLMHCHILPHFAPRPLLGALKAAEDDPVPHYRNHAIEGMAGLVVGMQINPRRTNRIASREPASRRLRLIAQPDSGGTTTEPAFGYVVQTEAASPVPTAGLLPGPTIVVRRGEPVSITVVNHLPEPTSVHWHGIELESYFDGVSGFSGQATQLAPLIEPRDSFEVRFTPPRSGTFIYHTHAHESRQLRAGLAGALLVLDPGQAYVPATDVVVLITTPRLTADLGSVYINGSLSPAPLDWRVGTTYRLRLINIHQNRSSLNVFLLADTTLSTWRAVAKDGVTLGASLATNRPARQQVAVGETYDFEYTPAAAGNLKVEVRAANGTFLGVLPVRVQ
jgi:FtsP/CotA-like multicopper oxidase with cupredoxin domain